MFSPNIDVYRHTKKTLKEREKAWHNLSGRSDIIIKPADKGALIVIMNKQDYITEAERELSGTAFYKSTDTDQTQIFKKKVFETLLTLAKNKKITNRMATSLQALSPVHGRIYMLPKTQRRDSRQTHHLR